MKPNNCGKISAVFWVVDVEDGAFLNVGLGCAACFVVIGDVGFNLILCCLEAERCE